MQISKLAKNLVDGAESASGYSGSPTMEEQVAKDLKSLIYSGKRNKVSFFSKKMGIHGKTLARICGLKNKPSYITVLKVYRCFLNSDDDRFVIENCPQPVKIYLKKANPQILERKIKYSIQVEKEVMTNPVALQIVALAGAGSINLTEIKDQFGKYGTELVQYLEQKQILTETSPKIYSLGSLRMNLAPETIKQMGLQLIQSYSKPQNGYEKGFNFQGLSIEGLSDEAYQEWLKIDFEAFEKKVKIAQQKKSAGTKKAFTFFITDTLIR